MSVTFQPALQDSDFIGTVATCAGDDTAITLTPMPHEDAALAGLVHSDACEDEICRVYGANLDVALAHTDLEVSVNVADGNASHLLDVLGLPFDGNGGHLDAADFKGRVLVAMALNPVDAGVPAHTAHSDLLGMTVIDAGRRPGYTDERLTHLLEVAEAALRQGRDVSWA